MTTNFYKQNAGTRLRFPNESEQVFDQLVEQGVMRNSAPWGLDDPKIDVPSLPAFVRYAPDRVQARGFVECKGVGKDGLIKVKLEQLYSLQWWDTIMPVEIFVWDSHRKQYTYLPLMDYMKICERNGTLQQFPDNNKLAWFLHVGFLKEAGWVKHA